MTQRDPIGWQYEYATHLYGERRYWSAVVTEAVAVHEAAHGGMTTGRVRPVYAGNATDARKPIDPDDDRVPFP